MKILVENSTTGLESLIGQNVTFFCMSYIYTGKMIAIDDRYILLENPKIVYETGDFKAKEWKDAQGLPNSIYIMLSAVESFGIVK